MAYHHVPPTPLEEGLKDFDSKAKIAEEIVTNDGVKAPSVVIVQTKIDECESLNRRASIRAISMKFYWNYHHKIIQEFNYRREDWR